MVRALIFIGSLLVSLACSSCRSRPKEEEEGVPQPIPNPGQSSFKKIDPKAVSEEFEGLFNQSFAVKKYCDIRLKSCGDGFVEVNPAFSAKLRSRLEDLTKEAYTNSQCAQAYDTKDVRKYAYYVHPELLPHDRMLLRRVDRGEISVLDAIRILDDRELAFVQSYQGQGNPFDADHYRNQALLADALRDICDPRDLENALMFDANRIVHSVHLLAPEEETLLRLTPSEELQKQLNDLSDRIPSLPEGRERSQALKKFAAISFLITDRGITDTRTYLKNNCRAIHPGARDETCALKADISLAEATANPFDNATLRPKLQQHLADYYRRYAALSPSERILEDALLLEGDLGIALRSGDFGPPLPAAAMDFLLGAVPPPPTMPMSWAEIVGVQQPTEITLQALPPELQAVARRLQMPDGQNLWDYLRKNVSSIILTRHTSNLGGTIQEPEATANRLMKTVIIDVDGPKGEGVTWYGLLSTLGHEAYHNDYFHQATLADGRLAKVLLVNERNAHLFQASILEGIVRQRLETRNPELKKLAVLLADRLMIGMAANEPLGYPRNDRSLRLDLKTDPKTHGHEYPTVFVPDYLRREGITSEKFYYKVRDELNI